MSVVPTFTVGPCAGMYATTLAVLLAATAWALKPPTYPPLHPGPQSDPRQDSVTHHHDDPLWDVLVYGATPGGIAAAVGAARTLGSGGRVVLVEPSQWIGGMVAGGLVCTDKVRAVSG